MVTAAYVLTREGTPKSNANLRSSSWINLCRSTSNPEDSFGGESGGVLSPDSAADAGVVAELFRLVGFPPSSSLAFARLFTGSEKGDADVPDVPILEPNLGLALLHA